jgi:two-component system NarL family response regulator
MRVVIVEDNRLLLENLRILLGGEPGIQVIGTFESAEEALGELRRCAPEVLLADLDLPGLPGVELIRRAKRSFPELDIMVFTVFEDRDTVFAALKAGASGYILKGSSPRELVEALHTLQQGGAPMSPRIARKVIQQFQEGGTGEDLILSHREKEIVKGIAQGMSYKELAERLCISPHTVHTHIKHIYDKLQVSDRAGAISKARKKGLI